MFVATYSALLLVQSSAEGSAVRAEFFSQPHKATKTAVLNAHLLKSLAPVGSADSESESSPREATPA